MKFLLRPFLPFMERMVAIRLSMGQYAEAEVLLNKIREISPRRARLHLNLGLTALAQNNFETAERELLLEMEYHGERYPSMKSLADLYYDWGKREKARSYYEKSLERCNHSSDRTLIEKRLERTENDETFSVALQSRDAVKKGRRLASERDFDGAYRAFEKAVEIDPYNLQALNNLGTIALRVRKEPQAAVDYLSRAAELTRVPSIHSNLATARRELGSRIK